MVLGEQALRPFAAIDKLPDVAGLTEPFAVSLL
jgi:hypothetical protein